MSKLEKYLHSSLDKADRLTFKIANIIVRNCLFCSRSEHNLRTAGSCEPRVPNTTKLAERSYVNINRWHTALVTRRNHRRIGNIQFRLPRRRMSHRDDSSFESRATSPRWNMSWHPRSWFNSNADPDLVNSFIIDNFSKRFPKHTGW